MAVRVLDNEECGEYDELEKEGRGYRVEIQNEVRKKAKDEKQE